MNLGQRIRVISFFATWSVVVWHCYCGSQVENWLIPVVCFWSVPWFFLVSGYFFVGSFERRGWLDLLMNKCRTLVLPYVMWCLVGFVVFVIASPKSLTFSLVDILAIGKSISPCYNKPLWYVRALIIFCLMGTGILALMKRMRISAAYIESITFIVMFGIFYVSITYCGIAVGPGSSPAYFCAGVVAAFWQKDHRLNISQRGIGIICISSLVGLTVTRGYWFAEGFSFASAGGVVIGNFATIAFIVFMFSFLSLDGVEKTIKRVAFGRLSIFLGTSAFVYFFHRPLLMCIIDRVNPWLAEMSRRNVLFVLLAVVYTPLCMVISIALYKISPKVYAVLTGGR